MTMKKTGLSDRVYMIITLALCACGYALMMIASGVWK